MAPNGPAPGTAGEVGSIRARFRFVDGPFPAGTYTATLFGNPDPANARPTITSARGRRLDGEPRRCRPVTGWTAATWYSSSTLSPEISFVVPARNEGEHLARTVGEIRRTMPPASEIIVVDDGSIDGSADAVACTARDDLRLVRAEGLGAAGARNYGAWLAEGDILVFLDAHMTLPQGWLEPLLDLVRCPEIGAAAPGIAVMGAPGHCGFGLRWTSPSLAVDWLPAPVVRGLCRSAAAGLCVRHAARGLHRARRFRRRACFLGLGGCRAQSALVASGVRAAHPSGFGGRAPIPGPPSVRAQLGPDPAQSAARGGGAFQRAPALRGARRNPRSARF